MEEINLSLKRNKLMKKIEKNKGEEDSHIFNIL